MIIHTGMNIFFPAVVYVQGREAEYVCPRGGHFLCKSTIFLNIKQSLSVNDNHGLISHKENEDSRSLFTQFGLKFYVFKNGFFFLHPFIIFMM